MYCRGIYTQTPVATLYIIAYNMGAMVSSMNTIAGVGALLCGTFGVYVHGAMWCTFIPMSYVYTLRKALQHKWV